MLKYILKRILVFIPTLIIIALLTFMINLNAPGDPVMLMMNKSGGGQEQSANKQNSQETYLKIREQLGLDMPVFYFSLSNQATPDTLYRIPIKEHRVTLERFLDKYGNWTEVRAYYDSLLAFETAAVSTSKDSLNEENLVLIRQEAGNLFRYHKGEKLDFAFEKINGLSANIPTLGKVKNALDNLKSAYKNMQTNETAYKASIPSLAWYGFNNQFHNWFFNFIQGDFGISYQDKRPISTLISERLFWTMLISFISILISYLIAIPLGVFSAVNKGSKADSVSTTILFVLYSLPNFWIATLLIMYLGGGDYFDWFPAYGLGSPPEGAGFFEVVGIRAYHLILPLICWTYATFAYLSRQMRGGILAILLQDYIRTARAKGLPESTITWKHAFRNSLLPIITLFANVFPLLIGGSVVLEVIFTIPGMGKWAFDGIVQKDYPVVYTVMMFSAILTMTGYLVADILYALVDPRIKFGK